MIIYQDYLKINLSYILSALLAVAFVALAFTFFEISRERNRLKEEIKNRSFFIAEDFNRMQPDSGLYNLGYQMKVSDSLSKHYNLLGFAVYYNNQFVSLSPAVKPYLNYSTDYILQSINSESPVGNFFSAGGKDILSIY